MQVLALLHPLGEVFMIKKIAIGLLGILPAIFSAQTPADPAKVCNTVLSTGIKDNYSVLTEKRQFDMYQDRLCKSNFSSYKSFQAGSASLGLDIPLAKGLLGLDGSVEQNSQQFKENYYNYCESTYFNSQSKELFSSSISKVSNALVSSWAECKKDYINAWYQANDTGTNIAITPGDGFTSFIVHVDVKAGAEKKPVEIFDIAPAGKLSCQRENKKIAPNYKVNLNEFLFTCTKPKHKEYTIAIDTNHGRSNSVTVPAETAKFSELSDKLDRLSSRTSELERNRIPSGAIAYFEQKDCPAGWSRAITLSGRYAVGVHEANKNETGTVIGNVLGHKEDRPVGAHTAEVNQ